MDAADRAVAPAHWDMDADVVVLGTGAAGLSAALAAAVGGARGVILEKTAVIGGTTAMSGGGTWVPNNAKMRAAGFMALPLACFAKPSLARLSFVPWFFTSPIRIG